MALQRFLRGSCSCGRNRYLVSVPETFAEEAAVYFDNSVDARRSHAAPLTAYLRVPLSYYQSSTYAFYNDETHSTIRRTYTPHHDMQRQFCGFCGTPLTSWTDRNGHKEAETICLTLGSLEDDDADVLVELGLIPDSSALENGNETVSAGPTAPHASGPSYSRPSGSIVVKSEASRIRGAPWFEEMTEDSTLGRIRRQRGGHQTGDTTVEWEVVEVDSSAGGSARNKRKAGENADDERGDAMKM